MKLVNNKITPAERQNIKDIADKLKDIAPINESIFNYIAPLLYKDQDTIDALKHYIFTNDSAYQAEIKIYGKSNNTVMLKMLRLNKFYYQCLKVTSLLENTEEMMQKFQYEFNGDK